MTPELFHAELLSPRGTRLGGLRLLIGSFSVMAVGVPLGVVVGFTSSMFIVSEVAAIAVTLLQDRLAMRLICGWVGPAPSKLE